MGRILRKQTVTASYRFEEHDDVKKRPMVCYQERPMEDSAISPMENNTKQQ